jgi:predicted Zn-dependent protease
MRPRLRTLASIAIATGLVAAGAIAKPYVPADDGVVLERLPERSDPRLAALKRLRARLAVRPDDLDTAVDVARRSLQAGRTTGDPRFVGQAEAALAPWWSASEPPPAVLLLRATIRQSQHAFDAALTDLDALLRASPGDSQALLVRATVLTVRGRYADAQQDCARLARVARELAAVTCSAAAASVSGDADAAYRALARSLASPEDNRVLRAWAETLAGEIAARRSDAEAADRHFRQALALEPGDAYAKAAYADFLLDRGRAREVVALLARDMRNDSLLLRLALAERRLPDQRAAYASHRAELADRFAAAARRGDTLHLREQARFALEIDDDAVAALALARRNWSLQREPADLRILAAAARAADDRSALKDVEDWLAATRLEDATVHALVRAGKR